MVSVPTMPGAGRPPSSIGKTRQARPDSRPAPSPAANTSGARDGTGAKLATFNWPPPPSPASGASRPITSPFKGKVSSGGLLGATGELDLSDAVAASDMRNREELWAVRADIEREKLRMVATFPFFGNPMRFSDDFAALQIAEDGRFSFSEMFTEVADTEASPCRNQDRTDMRRIVTYEGVFTALLSTVADEDHGATGRPGSPGNKAKTPASPTRRPGSPGIKSKANLSSSTGMSKTKDAVAEDTGRADTEQSGIEATALVKTEMIQSGGRSKLVSVERGAFRFELTVSPFFQPVFATVKVLAKCCGQPPRRRRLPYIGTGCATKTKSPGSMVKPQSQSSSLIGLSTEMRPATKSGGARLKNSSSANRPNFLFNSRSGALLPPGSVESPFKCAASESLASPQIGLDRKVNFGAGSPQRQSPFDVMY